MDISRVKFGDELTPSNIGGFEVGDIIQITEKWDGSNASIRYDIETGKLVAFSRRLELTFNNTLNGFWNYVQNLNAEDYKETPNYVIFGEWGCLSGDTIIRKTSAGKNEQYMTIRDMYKYLNTPTNDKYHHNPNRGRPSILKFLSSADMTEGELFRLYNSDYYPAFISALNWNIKNKYIDKNSKQKFYITEEGKEYYQKYLIGDSWWRRHGMPSIFSLFQDEWVIRPNKILDIYYTGDKEVYEVTTKKGYVIKTTKDHKFLTPRGFVPLESLNEFDCVAVSKMCNTRPGRIYGKGTKQLLDKQKEYKEKIGKCEKCGLNRCLELHHRDGNPYNNDESNWTVLCNECHDEVHKMGNTYNSFQYECEFDFITSIKYIGIEDCYDIAMEGTENEANYVANGFIVHNCKNAIRYNQDAYGKWYVYDIYDVEKEEYLPQTEVKKFVEKHGLTYIHVLYEGEFISWEHCQTFCNSPAYGDKQEGIVIKNQTKLNNPHSRTPFVLKIVNDCFSEVKKDNHRQKLEDPQKIKEKEHAQNIIDMVVTKRRVEKEIYKMRDEGIVPEKINPSDMKIVAQNLPKRIYDDCLKEEKELVESAGEYFGKMCSSKTMYFAREIILGN